MNLCKLVNQIEYSGPPEIRAPHIRIPQKFEVIIQERNWSFSSKRPRKFEVTFEEQFKFAGVGGTVYRKYW